MKSLLALLALFFSIQAHAAKGPKPANPDPADFIGTWESTTSSDPRRQPEIFIIKEGPKKDSIALCLGWAEGCEGYFTSPSLRWIVFPQPGSDHGDGEFCCGYVGPLDLDRNTRDWDTPRRSESPLVWQTKLTTTRHYAYNPMGYIPWPLFKSRESITVRLELNPEKTELRVTRDYGSGPRIDVFRKQNPSETQGLAGALLDEVR